MSSAYWRPFCLGHNVLSAANWIASHLCSVTLKQQTNQLKIPGPTHQLVQSSALYTLIDTWFLYSSRGVGVWSLPWRWHILPSHWQQVEEQASKPVGWTMCFLLMTLVPVQKLCVYIYIYIYICIPYMSPVIGRIYNGSVIQYWRSCTPSRSIGLYFWGVRVSWAECHFLFSLVYQLCLALW